MGSVIILMFLCFIDLMMPEKRKIMILNGHSFERNYIFCFCFIRRFPKGIPIMYELVMKQNSGKKTFYTKINHPIFDILKCLWILTGFCVSIRSLIDCYSTIIFDTESLLLQFVSIFKHILSLINYQIYTNTTVVVGRPYKYFQSAISKVKNCLLSCDKSIIQYIIPMKTENLKPLHKTKWN